MITQIKYSIIIFILIIMPLHSNPSESDFNRFLTGILFLKANDTIDPESKIEKYIQLKEITGIDASDAVQYLEKYRNKPQKFKAVFDSMKSLITENPKQKRKKE